MTTNVPCFFSICSKATEAEFIRRGLCAEYDFRLPQFETVEKGHLGFVLNVSSNELLGIFIAEGKVQLNIEPEAYEGKFPAQIKVKLLGELQRVKRASFELMRFVKMKKVAGKSWYVPAMPTYGADKTSEIVTLFKNQPELKQIEVPPREIGEIPQFQIGDVAGLTEIKQFINQRILTPYEDEETAYLLGLRIGGGILLCGLPGTGKTLIAKSIAENIQAKFIDISPSIIVGYPGDAERRLESIFGTLEKEPRAILFFDEAEWILSREQSSSVMQRITPVLKVQLSRIFKQRTKPIIVIAATNKPNLIDSAFLRPGRFDKVFCIGLPGKDARTGIIKMEIKKRPLRDRMNRIREDDIMKFAELLDGYSGADISHLIDEAVFMAFNRKQTTGEIFICIDDLYSVKERVRKSVTPHDIEDLEGWAKKNNLKIIRD